MMPVKDLDTVRRPPAPRQRLFLVLKAAVTLGILIAMFWHYHEDFSQLTDVPPWSAMVAVGCLLLQPPLIGFRWWLLLRHYHRLPLWRLVRTTWVSVFANQFLPAGVGGDAVRILYAKRDGASLGAAAASVFMDRIMALVALVVVIVLLAPKLPAGVDRQIVMLMGAICVLGICALAAIFIYVLRWGDASRFPLVQRLLQLVFFMLRILKTPVTLVATLILSVLVHILSFAAFLILARSVGVEAPIGGFLAIAALISFVQIMPISIGGWGVREIAAVTLLGTIGIQQGDAFVASLLLGICYALASLPGAVIWPFVSRASIAQPHASVR